MVRYDKKFYLSLYVKLILNYLTTPFQLRIFLGLNEIRV